MAKEVESTVVTCPYCRGWNGEYRYLQVCIATQTLTNHTHPINKYANQQTLNYQECMHAWIEYYDSSLAI